MSYVKGEIRVYKKTGEQVWSSSYTTYNVSSQDVTKSIEVDKDSFRFELPNVNGEHDDSFAVNDRVEVYFWRNAESATSNDLVIDGLIETIKYQINASQRRIVIKGNNRAKELLNSLVFIDEEETTVDQIIQDIVDYVNNNNQAGSSSNQHFIDTNIQATQSDGSAFPTKNFSSPYKRAYDLIEQFSGDEYTEDGQYLFYIDKNNVLQWLSKPSTVNATAIQEGVNCRNIDIDRGVFEVINAVIADVGRDPYEHGNHILQINPTSIIADGAKWKFLDYSSISEDLVNAEVKANPGSFDKTGGSEDSPTSNFPNGYNYTMQFNEIDEGQDTGSKWVVSSDSEYNNAIRVRAKYDGRKKAAEFLKNRGSVRWKGKIELNGTTDYTRGEFIDFTSTSIGLTNFQLRVKNITHRLSKNGWITTLDVIEDTED